MWGIFELVILFLQIVLLLPRNPESRAKIDEAMSRRLERFRWLIYGVILMGVLMLACAGIALMLAP